MTVVRGCRHAWIEHRTKRVSHDEERAKGAGLQNEYDRAPRHWLDPLLGAVVGVNMIGYEGRWLVVRDEGGAKAWVQRPQDFKPRWVMRRYVKAIEAPNDAGQWRAAQSARKHAEPPSARPLH
jgi:hypothetical protein